MDGQAVLAPLGPGPFVGRAAELAALDGALERARGGDGGLVLVTGEAGIGKTRLADEVAGRARTRGLRVLWGRAWEEGGAPPFWPWTQVLRTLMAEVGVETVAAPLGPRARELSRLLPELLDRAAGAAPPLETERARFLFFDAVTAVLRTAAGVTPTVVVLDDLHAADAASLHLLLFLARLRPAAPLLLLALLRDAHVRAVPALADVFERLVREGMTLPLPAFDAAEVAVLAHGRAGRALPDGTVRAIHEATGGNPLFADELVRFLVAQPAGKASERPPPLPDGVRAAIRSRCAPLGPDAHAVVRAAAVLGREFELPVLATIADGTAARVDDAVHAAGALGLVTPVPGHPARFRFAHLLVRDTLYGEMSPAERARRHRAAADALERFHAGRLEPLLATVAQHRLAAADPGAARYAHRAAEYALAQLAPEEAVRLAECGLAALESHAVPDGDRERLALLLVLGEAHRRAGDARRARAILTDAADTARRLGDADGLARAALAYGHARPTQSGSSDRRLVQLLEGALAGLPPGDAPRRADLLGRLGEELYFTNERQRGGELAADAVAMARRVGRDDVLARALVRRYFTLWGPDTAADALALSTEAASVAARAGLREVQLIAGSWRVYDLLQHGDADAADAEIATYDALTEELELPEFRWRLRLLRATRALMRGEFAHADALVREAAAIEDGQHGQTPVQLFAVQRVALALEAGRPGALEEVAPAMRALAERLPMPVWRSASARVSAELGRTAEARRDLDALARDGFAGVRRDGNWLTTMMNAAETAALVGDVARAAVLYDLLRPFAGLHVVVAHACCFGSVERYLGRLAAALRRWPAADAHFARAAEADGRTGAAPFVAHTRAAWGEMLVTAHVDPQRGAALLDEARSAAGELGMQRLVERLGSGPRSVARGAWLFRRDGEYWTIGDAARPVRLRDGRGLGYLHQLLTHAGRGFAAIELAAPPEPGVRGGGDGPVVDARSRDEYRRRLAEIRAAQDEAAAHHDVGRTATLAAEAQWLTEALAHAVGLGGRLREAGSVTERARTAVTKAIRGAIRRIGAADAAVGRHLMRSVRTGTCCVYEPDPSHPVAWHL